MLGASLLRTAAAAGDREARSAAGDREARSQEPATSTFTVHFLSGEKEIVELPRGNRVADLVEQLMQRRDGESHAANRRQEETDVALPKSFDGLLAENSALVIQIMGEEEPLRTSTILRVPEHSTLFAIPRPPKLRSEFLVEDGFCQARRDVDRAHCREHFQGRSAVDL